jgi:hypothetical protein
VIELTAKASTVGVSIDEPGPWWGQRRRGASMEGPKYEARICSREARRLRKRDRRIRRCRRPGATSFQALSQFSAPVTQIQ